MSYNTKNPFPGWQEGREHRVGLVKKIIGKGLQSINDQWKQLSNKPRSPSVVIGTSPKEFTSKSKINAFGAGQYELLRPLKHKTHTRIQPTKFPTQPSTKYMLNGPQGQSYFHKKSLSINVNNSNKSLKVTNGCFTTEIPKGITFPKQTRENLQSILNRDRNDSPGPGKYRQVQFKSAKNAFSFYKSKKFGEEEKELSQKGSIPAPGKYELAQSRKSLRGSKFTQALRMATEQALTPGPASHYSVTASSLSHRGGTIDRQKKMSFYETETPGPGSYQKVELNKLKKKDAIAVIGRSSSTDLKGNVSVGPGTYFRQKIFQQEKIVGGTIDRSLRTSSITEVGPGPISYAPNYKPIFSQCKKTVFGRQARQPNAKIILPKRKKDTNLSKDLMSSHANYYPFNTKAKEREISRTSISHY